MTVTSQDDIARLVQAYLDRHQASDYRLNVVTNGIERRKDWWYVTVLPDRNGVQAYDYSNRLTLAEEELQDNESLKVLLVPTIVDD